MPQLRPQQTKAVAVATRGRLRQSTKHGNKQCLCLLSLCYWQEGAFEKLKYTPRKCAHDAHPRGVLISAAVDLARRRRRNFARRHNDSCKMTYARKALWKRAPGSLITATGLQKLASSQQWWLAGRGWTRSELQAAAPTGAAASAASSKV